MKKHTLAWAALCFSVLMLTGCALFAQQSRSAAEEDTLALDPLTGEAARWPGQRPAAVFIDNGPEASRQWGIGEASVVFEALTEGEMPPVSVWSTLPWRRFPRRGRWPRGGISISSFWPASR